MDRAPNEMAWQTKSLSVAQWLECPTSIWEVVGLNPIGDSDFFSLSHACGKSFQP